MKEFFFSPWTLVWIAIPLVIQLVSAWKDWRSDRRQRPRWVVSAGGARVPPSLNGLPERPVDIDRTARAVSEDFDDKVAFVVMRHGTCVIVDPRSTTKPQDAITALREVFRTPPGFNGELGRDHWLVSFAGRAFSVVFSDELVKHGYVLGERHREWLAEDEVLVDEEGLPVELDIRNRVGLFARCFGFLDSADPQVALIVEPGQ